MEHSGNAQAAEDWLRFNYDLIPERLRPPRAEIDEFAAFFSTFLISSFDLVAGKPGSEGRREWAKCQCELCRRFVNAPRLKAKTLYAHDKLAAEHLMEEFVWQLARENGLAIDELLAKQLVTGPQTRRSAAYMTYGHWLIQRLSGLSDGPAILVLWRLIAWDPRGGMRPNFELKIEDFRAAEKCLLAAIQGAR